MPFEGVHRFNLRITVDYNDSEHGYKINESQNATVTIKYVPKFVNC